MSAHSHGVYAIYDRKAGYHLPLFNVPTDTDAIRQFTQIVTQSETPVSQYPADFDLVRLGVFNITSGLIDPEVPLGLIINGLVAYQDASRERQRYAAILNPSQTGEAS